MHACLEQLHAYSCMLTAAAGTDYTLWVHSNASGEGRRCLRVALAREAGSVGTVYEVELHTRHNGGKVGTVIIIIMFIHLASRPELPYYLFHTYMNLCYLLLLLLLVRDLLLLNLQDRQSALHPILRNEKSIYDILSKIKVS